MSRYPTFIYQVDLGTRSFLLVFFAALGLTIFNFESKIKDHPWVLYVFSILAVLVVEVGHSINSNKRIPDG